ncbi:hypothetical protein G4B88_020805 [Cannabis sativa]|uniref:Uncharacterized protein n=1 Tax=Cannabis sativa TaxID=3483 RepID=A0A7J6HNB0_CANSA|nr:hypothetical protein G4B88_020805 [Cannabis sativa]
MAGPGRLGSRNQKESAITRVVNSVFGFVKMAEFEILFVLFFVIAFLIFKDLTSRPEYNQLLVKKPEGGSLRLEIEIKDLKLSNYLNGHLLVLFDLANNVPSYFVDTPTFHPSVGTVKLNTDAAILGNEKKLGLGAKLCDHEAMVLVLVVWPSSLNLAPDVSEILFHSQRD